MDDNEVKSALIENNTEALHAIPDSHRFSDGTSLIHWASMYGNKHVFERVATTLNVNEPGGMLNSTPLYYAAYNSNHRLMAALLERGASTAHVNGSGAGLLHTCTRFDDVLGVVLLLCYGADAGAVDRRGRTLLEYAAERNSRHVLRFLQARRPARSIRKNALLIGMHGLFLSLGMWSRLALAALFFLCWWRIAHTRFSAYLNIFYTLYIGWMSVRARPELAVHVARYIHALLRLLLCRPRFGPARLHSESRGLVLRMINDEEYDTRHFCYTCLERRARGSRHCSICNRCVLDFDHHCPCIDRCVDKHGMMCFRDYLFATFTVAATILLSGMPGITAELVAVAAFVLPVMIASGADGWR